MSVTDGGEDQNSRLSGGRVFVETGYKSGTFYPVPRKFLTDRVRSLLVKLLVVPVSAQCLDSTWFTVYRDFISLVAVLRAENLCNPLRIGDMDDDETLRANNPKNVFVFHHSVMPIVLDRAVLGLLLRDTIIDPDSDNEDSDSEDVAPVA
jgi:hypothetical protein